MRFRKLERRTRLVIVGAVFALLQRAGAVQAAPPALRMAIDSATQMPMARIEGNRVTGGMNHELGGLLAARMGRRIDYLAVPRKRLLAALESGEADMVCTYLPEWLPATSLRWGPAFFVQSDLLITRRDAAAPAKLADLAGVTVGTVLGFEYPELQRQLGSAFRREDAPSAEANLRKLAAARLHHAIVEQRLLRHLQRSAVFGAPIHAELKISTLRTRCALGPRAAIAVQELTDAIAQAERDGALAALYQRYD